MPLSFQDLLIDTGSPDEDGRLVFADGRLIAVLVRLSEQHGHSAGHWFVEVAFGRLGGRTAPLFPDFGQAQLWMEERLR